MGIPEPIVHTTLIFMAIVAAFCVMQLFLRCLRVCSKHDTSIALVLYPLAGFSCWLLCFLCLWLSFFRSPFFISFLSRLSFFSCFNGFLQLI